MSQAAGQVNILIFLLKIKCSPCMPLNFVMQGKCLFSDISRPVYLTILALSYISQIYLTYPVLNLTHPDFTLHILHVTLHILALPFISWLYLTHPTLNNPYPGLTLHILALPFIPWLYLTSPTFYLTHPGFTIYILALTYISWFYLT